MLVLDFLKHNISSGMLIAIIEKSHIFFKKLLSMLDVDLRTSNCNYGNKLEI